MPYCLEMCDYAGRRARMKERNLNALFDRVKASVASNEEHSKSDELQGLWEFAPEDVFVHLPSAMQCRLRCVCPRWKLLLSAPFDAIGERPRPSYTLLCDGEYSEDFMFCHEGHKWYRFPFQPRLSVDFPDRRWILVATDGGLLCYESSDGRSVSALVCNPMTGSYQVFDTRLRRRWGDTLCPTEFFVDLKMKTFKIFFMAPEVTVVFNSMATPAWEVFQSGALAHPTGPEYGYGFVWKNVIYRRTQELHGSRYLAFNMESGVWSDLEDIGLPCEVDTKKSYSLTSWKGEVLLVQIHPVHKDPVCIWMLQEDPTKPCNLLAARWEKVPVEIPEAMKVLVGAFRYCLSHGNEYVCFTTGWIHHLMKYTIKTRTWEFMPRRPRNRVYPISKNYAEELFWFNFEPHTTLNPKPDIEGDGYPEMPHHDLPDVFEESSLVSDVDLDESHESD